MKKQLKKYDSPRRAWQKDRINKEKILMKDFGLTSKREIWRLETKLRNMRREAKNLIASKDERKKRDIIEKLHSWGLIKKDASLDDILDLTIEDMLKRTLQTVVQRRGLSQSLKEARQLITHGKVSLGNRKVTIPSYMVRTSEEGKISVKRGGEKNG